MKSSAAGDINGWTQIIRERSENSTNFFLNIHNFTSLVLDAIITEALCYRLYPEHSGDDTVRIMLKSRVEICFGRTSVLTSSGRIETWV